METQKKLDKHSPIGVFDSGLGGLTAVKEIIDRKHRSNVFKLKLMPYFDPCMEIKADE